MDAIKPVGNSERVVFMDVLRGIAILGIFIANLGSGLSGYNDELTGPYLLPEADPQMSFLHRMFLEGKFYTIFSLLFGWGMALQIKRGLDIGNDPIPLLYRRIWFMLLLGAVHLLIWPGDIVFFYALLSFILLPLRKYSNKTLLITAIILILLPILLYALKSQWLWLNAPAGLFYQTGEKLTQVLTGVSSEKEYLIWSKQAGWWDLFKSNLAGFFYRYGYLFFVSRIPKVLGVFLIGFVIGRTDFYKTLMKNKLSIYWFLGLGLLIGLPANYYLAYFISNYENDYWNLGVNGLYQTIFYAIGVVPLALAYVALLFLVFETTLGKKFLSILAPVGKMAFSNYIFQSIIAQLVFFGAGLGYTGQLGPVYYTFFGLGVFIFQIILSTIWLKYMQYGPIEWIWRSLTYGKRQDFFISKINESNEQRLSSDK